MVDDIKDIEKLSPQERIKKLKELEEKNKQEIEKARRIIAESEDELELQEKLKQVEIPETEEVNVANLFKREESLEETVRKERPEISEEDLRQQKEYFANLEAPKIEERISYLRETANNNEGYMTNEQLAQVVAIYEEAVRKQYHSTSDKVREEFSSLRRIAGETLSEVIGQYRR